MRVFALSSPAATLSRSRAILCAAAVTATLTSPSTLAAQQHAAPGTIIALVQDSAGARIASAELTVMGSAARGYTDDDGRLRLPSVGPGMVRLLVRRLGFRPTTVDVTVIPDSSTTAIVRLAPIAEQLRTILVRASSLIYRGILSGFYERRAHGMGHFITHTDIERAQPMTLTDMFRRIPGVRIGSTYAIRNAVRMRGDVGCAPLVWVDGMPAAAAEFDLDDIDPQSVAGVEIYNGLAEVPVQFMPPLTIKACGVIVVWTRQGEPHARAPKHPLSAAQVAALVDAGQVYTADQVDTPARQDTSVHVAPAYPEALLLDGTSGKVTAQFVVDTTGRVQMETFDAISSSDPAFTSAVRTALSNASYYPAILDGRRVLQVVQQPFTFVADSLLARKRPPI